MKSAQPPVSLGNEINFGIEAFPDYEHKIVLPDYGTTVVPPVHGRIFLTNGLIDFEANEEKLLLGFSEDVLFAERLQFIRAAELSLLAKSSFSSILTVRGERYKTKVDKESRTVSYYIIMSLTDTRSFDGTRYNR